MTNDERRMRVLLFEAVCAGLCGDAPGESLLREGAAMWRAVLDDLRDIPGVSVTTCLDEAWRDRWSVPEDVDVFWSAQPAEQSLWWVDALSHAGAVLVIAPETAGLLAELCGKIRTQHPRRMYASAAAIKLCSDKAALAEHCVAHQLPTIPTVRETWRTPPVDFSTPYVIKPADGAGGWLVRKIANRTEWDAVRREYRRDAPESLGQSLRQPFVSGRALSVAGLFSAHAPREWLPVAEQHLTWERTVRYCGGQIPAGITSDEAAAVTGLAASVADTIPGLNGYIGFDIILTEDGPLLVEINPRLTTSYIGYRRLCASSLMARWLTLACATAETISGREPLHWHDGPVRFLADGTVTCA